MKTATSFLQRFLSYNTSRLHDFGFDFPDTLPPDVSGHRRRNGSFLVGNLPDYADGEDELRGSDVQARDFGLARLDESFETYDDVICSDELLWTGLRQSTRRILSVLEEHARSRGWRVRVVVFLRRQDSFAVSLFSQQVKGRFMHTADVREWIAQERPDFDYLRILRGIASVIGPENIDVCVYDRAALDAAGGIHACFLECLGLDANDGFRVPEVATNPTLTPNLIAAKLPANALFERREESARLFTRAAIRAVRSPELSRPTPPLLSADEARAFLARFEDDNRLIARDFLHTDRPLFADDFDEREPWSIDDASLFSDAAVFWCEVNRLQNERISAGVSGVAGGSGCFGRKRWLDDFELDDSLEPRRAVLAALASFFVARQRAIDAGSPTRRMRPEAVRDLVDELCVRAGLTDGI